MKYLMVWDGTITSVGIVLVEGLFRNLNDNGHLVRQIKLEDKGYDYYLPEFLEMDVEAVLTFDMAGMSIVNKETETLYNLLFCNCYHLLTRSPWFYPDGLLRRMNFTTTVIAMNRRDAEYIRYFYENVPKVAWLKDVVCSEVHKTPKAFWNGRNTLIVDHEEKVQVLKRINQLTPVFRELACYLISQDRKSYLPLLAGEYFERIHFQYKEDEFVELLSLLRDVELYWDEAELQYCLDSIFDRGEIPTVLGEGWESYNSRSGADKQVYILEKKDIHSIKVDYSWITSIISLIRCE